MKGLIGFVTTFVKRWRAKENFATKRQRVIWGNVPEVLHQRRLSHVGVAGEYRKCRVQGELA